MSGDRGDITAIELTENTHDVLPFPDLPQQGLITARKRNFLLRHDLHRAVMHYVDNLPESLHTFARHDVDEGSPQTRWTQTDNGVK